MKKIKYLSKKLKAFTFDDIFLLAETPKKEVKEALEDLIKENILKKTSQGFVYCDLEQVPPPTEPLVIGRTKADENKPEFIAQPMCKSLRNEFKEKDSKKIKPLTDKELEVIPKYNKVKYDKYIRLLKLTRGLYGTELKNFVEEYNKLNPQNPTSYSNLIRKRHLCAKFGTASLIAKYGHSTKVYYPDMEKYYSCFKKLYFSNSNLSIEECRKNTAKKFDIPPEKFPCVMTFRRRLHKDFTTAEVKRIRRNECF